MTFQVGAYDPLLCSNWGFDSYTARYDCAAGNSHSPSLNLDFVGLLNTYNVASSSDISVAVAPLVSATQVQTMINNSLVGISSGLSSSQVQSMIDSSYYAQNGGSFDSILAGEFFGFSFCGVVVCWAVSHCAAMILKPLWK